MTDSNEAARHYHNVHVWMSRHYGRPSECEECGTTEAKRFEWAQVHGAEIAKDRTNFRRLCTKCHHAYDEITARFTPGQLKEIARKRQAARTPEAISEAVQKRIKTMGPEARSEAIRKGWETRRRNAKRTRHERK